MKLNENHIAGLIRNSQIKNQLIKTQQNYAKAMLGHGSEADPIVEHTFTEILEPNVKSYLIRKTAMDMVERIKIDGSFDPKVLKKVPIQKAEIILNENQLYRYWFDGTVLRGIFIEKVKTYLGPEVRYHSFTIDPDTKLKSLNIYTDVKVSEAAERLWKLMIFLYFSEVQTVLLAPNGKIGTLSTERFKNELKCTFVVVDTTWNRISIRTTGFNVCGHFRLQACGKNREDRKLIFIEEFGKEGYIRGAGKIRET